MMQTWRIYTFGTHGTQAVVGLVQQTNSHALAWLQKRGYRPTTCKEDRHGEVRQPNSK